MHNFDLALITVLVAASGACNITIGDGTESDSNAAAPWTTTGVTEDAPTEAVPTEAAGTGTSTGTTEGGTTGAPAGKCGWKPEDKIYACGGVGEDPDGLVPIACAEPPVAGAPCDGDQGPVADPGCCDGDIEAYCYLGELIVTQCE